MTRGLLAIASVLAISTLLSAPAGAVTYALRGSVVGNGGDVVSNATRVLHGTVGQGSIGVGGNATRIVCSGFWCFGGARVIAVDGGGDGVPGTPLPTEVAFGMPAPNPSRGDVRFSLALPKAATVRFAVYDVAGRQLGEEVSQTMGAGYQQLVWRAPSDHSGVYFGVLRVDGELKAERRMVLVR